MNHHSWFAVLLSMFFGCQPGPDHRSGKELQINLEGRVLLISLEAAEDTGFNLISKESETGYIISTWDIKHEVYRLDKGDVNADGIDDILVGVIKPTRFDPKPAKRLFIFKLFEGHIRPLWLGSRMAMPLVDFRIKRNNDPVRICTVEKEMSGTFAVGEYVWKGFGLQLEKYTDRNLSQEQAIQVLNYD